MRLSASRTGPLRLVVPGRLGRTLRLAATLSSRVAAWPASRVHWKIILPYALLVLILGGAATYLATGLVTSSLGERVDNQLVQAARVSTDATARWERRNIESVRALTFTEGLGEAVAARDTADIGRLVEGTAANNGIEYLEVLDKEGARLKAVYLADAGSTEYRDIANTDATATWEPVREVLHSTDGEGAKATAIVETSDDTVFYTAGAIRSGDGTLIGAVLVGASLQTVVEEMKAEALADITVYAPNGEVQATTFPQAETDNAAQADLSLPGTEAADAFEGGVVFREPRTIWGRDYNVLYAPLRVQGKELGSFSAALPADFIMEAESDTRWKMVTLFALGMIGTLAAGFYLSRLITSPVQSLVRTAERVSAGDFSARTSIKSRDEIGRLGVAIDQMTETLQGQYLGTLRALASAVANKDPATLSHMVRVGQLAAMLGRHFQLDDRTLAQLEIGGYLHDVGKIGIRDSARLKLEALTPDQRRLLESHPHLDILAEQRDDIRSPVRAFVQGGRGVDVGRGLTAGDEEGPVVARIVEVADLYDAIRFGEAKPGSFTPDQALEFLRTHVGAVISIGMLEALAVVVPEWERRRSSESELLRHTAPQTTDGDSR
jgi:HD-GYP domain-containing protein (c-di-GMP phosphodiesterase class II)